MIDKSIRSEDIPEDEFLLADRGVDEKNNQDEVSPKKETGKNQGSLSVVTRKTADDLLKKLKKIDSDGATSF